MKGIHTLKERKNFPNFFPNVRKGLLFPETLSKGIIKIRVIRSQTISYPNLMANKIISNAQWL